MVCPAEFYYSSRGAQSGGCLGFLLAGGESFPEEVFTGGFAVALGQR